MPFFQSALSSITPFFQSGTAIKNAVFAIGTVVKNANSQFGIAIKNAVFSIANQSRMHTFFNRRFNATIAHALGQKGSFFNRPSYKNAAFSIQQPNLAANAAKSLTQPSHTLTPPEHHNTQQANTLTNLQNHKQAESQQIVATRPLYHLQYPVPYPSRLQRIHPLQSICCYYISAAAPAHFRVGNEPALIWCSTCKDKSIHNHLHHGS